MNQTARLSRFALALAASLAALSATAAPDDLSANALQEQVVVRPDLAYSTTASSASVDRKMAPRCMIGWCRFRR